jgi:hypothetical protein
VSVHCTPPVPTLRQSHCQFDNAFAVSRNWITHSSTIQPESLDGRLFRPWARFFVVQNDKLARRGDGVLSRPELWT